MMEINHRMPRYMESSAVEEFITRTEEGVVSLRCDNHHGYDRADNSGYGVVFNGDLYLLVFSSQDIPTMVLETMSRKLPGQPNRFTHISRLSVVSDARSFEPYLAKLGLDALKAKQDTILPEVRLEVMVQDTSRGISIGQRKKPSRL